ncbi:crossover junction endodeoxyribonuclease RuvC [Paramagnetospirillum magneticum]|uniref:Crossover junction endodeoxyribonuclease RuvC n=1 Tax=Paramagnetospirillum magneticum (strain ATCC 700264 / AMB-1) TaxID=342108 RepID=RUVC_PARM1|nr:crossover junction endodeoxyribonuclease RuvC [Paramagnetospirillum magneticum]Q2W2A2.1 RecName: Full=Crossover junction endodeoxyribonuclease RuvC; AltName: Full=Holliday junction nuclease RuvC; AltName: Full=Holliday junction resolvase RuvC [Paramagnetospirillum magneticum AMB-1]BAE52023.1 Holliday junction resolvasome, endonuclease subunit [Paramagnetospirillum magneticum AMB-1]
MRILGLDPGLRNTGWGIIDAVDNRLRHVADGVIRPDASAALAERLVQLHDGIMAVIADFSPDEAAVEETFVNMNPASTLKLGQARGVVLLVPAKSGLPVGEYAATLVKQSVVGTGRAAKEQVGMMVKTLLPGCLAATADAADALAVAICHAHHRGTQQKLARAVAR